MTLDGFFSAQQPVYMRVLLPYSAGERNGLAEDSDAVHFFVPVDKRFIHGVLWFQRDVVIEKSDTLQSGFIINEDGGNFAVLYGILLANVNNVTVEDAGVYHTVAFAGEREIGLDVLGNVDVFLDVFIRQDRLATSDGANERNLAHFGHGNDVTSDRNSGRELQLVYNVRFSQKIIHINIEIICDVFQRLEIRFAFAALIHINAAFRYADLLGKIVLGQPL